MIYLEKKMPGPTCLEVEKKKANGDYKCGCVLDRLSTDFHNKCYICEDRVSVANVEHFRPHREDKDMKFSWRNLFLACGHCNNIKSDNFEAILDCTHPMIGVETRIKYFINPFPKEYPVFLCANDDPEAMQTKALLEDVFNGTTKLKKMESATLRDELVRDIGEFQDSLMDYFNPTSDIEHKERCRIKINQHLHIASRFCSFKRWIVKNNEAILAEFGGVFL